jgi:L-ascorbate metabolism protein UlaG (beta-lactamase superfamily)
MMRWLFGYAALLLVLTPSCAKNPGPPPPPTAPAPMLGGARPSDVLPTSKGDLRITPLHHATLLLQLGGRAIYVDPVHDISYEGLPKADLIFITDIHPDHLDPGGLQLVSQATTTVVVPPAVAAKMPAGMTNIVVMKNGETNASKSITLPTLPWLAIEAVPMYNLTRGPAAGALYHDKGRGNGYVLTIADKRLYISGDTECIPEMKALKKIDVAFVCMNLPYTMPPSEAAACINAFRPKIVYPYHFKGSDLAELQKAVPASSGVEVRVRDWYAP